MGEKTGQFTVDRDGRAAGKKCHFARTPNLLAICRSARSDLKFQMKTNTRQSFFKRLSALAVLIALITIAEYVVISQTKIELHILSVVRM